MTTHAEELKLFLARLAAVKDQFTWRVREDSMIRGWPSEGLLRKCGWACSCPVTAVALVELGLCLPSSHFAEAAFELGIDQDLTGLIVTAADRGEYSDQEPAGRIREALLSLLNLKEVDSDSLQAASSPGDGGG